MAKRKEHGRQGPSGGRTGRPAPTISLCMIVRNEEANLERCLASVRDVVDEMIVVDTGSTDGTVALAQRLGAKVHHVPWTHDFSAARNAALAHATGDWVLHLDADEELDREDARRLRRLAAAAPRDVWTYVLPVLSVHTGRDHSVSYQKRLFRRLPGHVQYERAIHEEVVYHGPGELRMQQAPAPRIWHYGYDDAALTDQKRRFRNLPLLLRAHREDPENRVYLFHLANSLTDPDQVLRYYQEGLARLHPGEGASELALQATAHVQEVLLGARRYRDVLEVGRKILERGGTTADVYYLMGRAALELEDLDQAAALFQRALARRTAGLATRFLPGSDTWLPGAGLVEVARRRRDYAQALRLMKQVLEHQPAAPGALGRAALFELRLGRPSGARDRLQAALAALEPEATDAFGQRAADAVRDALAGEPDPARLLDAVASLLSSAGDHDAAADALSFRLEAGPEPDLLYRRGLCHVRRGRQAAAEEDFTAAAVARPGWAPPLLELGRLRRSRGDRSGAREAFQAAVAADPTHVEGWLELARLDFAQGRLLRAEEHARRALELRPEDEEASLLLADACAAAGKLQEAYDLLEPLVRQHPDRQEPLFRLVALLHRAGEDGEALAVLSSAVDRFQDDAGFYVRLGDALGELGRHEDAFNAYEVALSLDPGAPVLNRGMALLRRVAGGR
ncbi:MAG TPA: glycosyltransferase [Dehalococcoidia bacterium]